MCREGREGEQGGAGTGDTGLGGVQWRSREETQLYTRDIFFGLAHQLLSALEFLHEQRDIAHQNLKPQNLLLDKGLDLKICDFGWPIISRQLCQNEGEEYDLHLIGTPGYIPPEVLQFYSSTKVGEANPHDHIDAKKWDAFSCGMVLYYMLERAQPVSSFIPHDPTSPPSLSPTTAQLHLNPNRPIVPQPHYPPGFDHRRGFCFAGRNAAKRHGQGVLGVRSGASAVRGRGLTSC